MIFGAALVAAVISMNVPGVVHDQREVRIERRACGQHYRAEVPVGGQWLPAEARVICARP